MRTLWPNASRHKSGIVIAGPNKSIGSCNVNECGTVREILRGSSRCKNKTSLTTALAVDTLVEAGVAFKIPWMTVGN